MYTLLIATLLCITFSSAGKKDHTPDSHKRLFTILSSVEGKKWKLTSWTATHAENGKEVQENMFDYFDDCTNDNTMILFANNKYEAREGASTCDSSAGDLVEAGRWALRKNGTQLAIISNGDTTVVNIKELNETTIKAAYTETDQFDGITYTITQIYQAQ